MPCHNPSGSETLQRGNCGSSAFITAGRFVPIQSFINSRFARRELTTTKKTPVAGATRVTPPTSGRAIAPAVSTLPPPTFIFQARRPGCVSSAAMQRPGSP